MTTILICIDGCAPAYLDAVETPVLDHLGREGRWVTGRGMMPSVTNVNNASLLTGLPPAGHGISGNYFLDDAGQGTYMESPDLLRAPLTVSDDLLQAQAGGPLRRRSWSCLLGRAAGRVGRGRARRPAADLFDRGEPLAAARRPARAGT